MHRKSTNKKVRSSPQSTTFSEPRNLPHNYQYQGVRLLSTDNSLWQKIHCLFTIKLDLQGIDKFSDKLKNTKAFILQRSLNIRTEYKQISSEATR